VGIEERFLEAIEAEQGDEVEPGVDGRLDRHHKKLVEKNKPAADRFLGKNQRIHEVGFLPRYYGELLTWALNRYMDREGWQVTQTLGYHGQEPVYIDVNTDCDQRENLLMDGQMLIQKGTSRFLVTVDVNLRWRNSILVEGPVKRKTEISEFVTGVLALAKEQNFYLGKKIEFAGRLRFLDLKDRSWESIILDENTKREIKANTTGFLNRKDRWEKYGIPPKRGVILAGESGTGKTIICKAIMAEAHGITCINTTAYAMDADEYLTELYELAEDLSPCLVFIEDIDLIGQNRGEFGYQRGNALLSLLSVLDGIEEKKEIVTVATTNYLEMLDKALSQRPSRFDRVIKLTRPSLEQRRELVSRLCQKIPLGEKLQEYVACKTEGCTPAQVQEVIHSMVIELSDGESGPATLSEHDIDFILSRINGRNGHGIGFCISPNHNGHKPDRADTIIIYEREE
jgi:cell division protease FtsH